MPIVDTLLSYSSTELCLIKKATRREDLTPKKVAFAALHHKDFRVYFIGTMLAMMADNIEHVISYWLLYQKFQSPTLAGFAVLVHWTPFLLFSVYFGAMADRYDCRKSHSAGAAHVHGRLRRLGVSVLD